MKRHRLCFLASKFDSGWRESFISDMLFTQHDQSDRRSSREQSIKKITPVGLPAGVLLLNNHPPLSAHPWNGHSYPGRREAGNDRL